MAKSTKPKKLEAIENAIVHEYGILLNKTNCRKVFGLKTKDDTYLDELVGGLEPYMIGKTLKYNALDIAQVVFQNRL